MGAPRFVMEDFWPSDLFLGGIPGAWYDPTDVNVNWRRNLLTYTEQFDNAAWTKGGLNTTGTPPWVNVTTAPDGTTTADQFIETAVNAQRSAYQSISITSGTCSFSVYAKPTGGAKRWLSLYPQGSGVAAYAVFDVDAGTVTLTGGASYLSSSVTSVGNGWYRCTVTFTAASPTVIPVIYMSNASNQQSPTYLGDGSSGLFLWGAQLEVGSTASAYQQIVTPEITYAATQTTNLFQDSTGTTPVWAVEQPVGLILDKSQGLALGAEVVANGTFATNVTGWTAQAGDTVSWDAGDSGRLKIDDTNGAGAGIAYQIINTVAGRGYTVQFSSKLGTAAQTRVYVGTAVGNASMAQRNDSADVTNGTIFFIASGATAYLQFVCQSTSAFSYLLDISVKPIAGNHASQSTAASRPTYRARYNLLTFSEDYANAAWTKTNVTLTSGQLAPDGTNTAFVLTGTAAYARIESTAVSYAAATYTLSVYVKKASGTMAIAFSNAGSSDEVAFDIGTGTVGTKGANVSSASVQDAGAWWRLVAVSTRTAASQPIRIFAGYPTNISPIVWGAQLLTAADVTATGNAYQRIAAATVYDTAPIFRPYLAFDGVDDSMATAAINFTSTDKMTVFAGVTKLSTATFDVAGLSADWPTNNGTFGIGSVSPNGWFFGLRGTGFEYYTATSFVAPLTSVLTASYNIGGATIADEIVPRVNGTAPTLTPSGGPAGTGNFGTHVLNISRSASWLNGRLFSLIVRGAASSVTEIADTELWVNARTGAY